MKFLVVRTAQHINPIPSSRTIQSSSEQCVSGNKSIFCVCSTSPPIQAITSNTAANAGQIATSGYSSVAAMSIVNSVTAPARYGQIDERGRVKSSVTPYTVAKVAAMTCPRPTKTLISCSTSRSLTLTRVVQITAVYQSMWGAFLHPQSE